MLTQTIFVIQNHFASPLILNIEPEGVFYPLSEGEEVTVTDHFTTAPVTLKLSRSERGEVIVSIWPGDGETRVEKDGVDILQLTENDIMPDCRTAGEPVATANGIPRSRSVGDATRVA